MLNSSIAKVICLNKNVEQESSLAQEKNQKENLEKTIYGIKNKLEKNINNVLMRVRYIEGLITLSYLHKKNRGNSEDFEEFTKRALAPLDAAHTALTQYKNGGDKQHLGTYDLLLSTVAHARGGIYLLNLKSSRGITSRILKIVEETLKFFREARDRRIKLLVNKKAECRI